MRTGTMGTLLCAWKKGWKKPAEFCGCFQRLV